jgi:hypothetical protein
MNRLYIAIVCIAISSCSPKKFSAEELQAYIIDEENGTSLTEELNGTKVTVTYRPTDLWVSHEIDHEVVSMPEIDSLRKRYSDYYYFTVSLSRNNKEALHQVNNMGEYSELVQTLSFRMPQYVTLTTAKQDTIPVGDFILNRTYGLSSTTDLLFVFNKKKAAGTDWVQFNLNEFGLGLGNQRFRFSTMDLEETPQINFSTDN